MRASFDWLCPLYATDAFHYQRLSHSARGDPPRSRQTICPNLTTLRHQDTGLTLNPAPHYPRTTRSVRQTRTALVLSPGAGGRARGANTSDQRTPRDCLLREHGSLSTTERNMIFVPNNYIPKSTAESKLARIRIFRNFVIPICMRFVVAFSHRLSHDF